MHGHDKLGLGGAVPDRHDHLTVSCRASTTRGGKEGGDALQSRWALSSWMLDAVAAAIAMEGCRGHCCPLDLVTEGRGSAPRQLLPLDPV